MRARNSKSKWAKRFARWRTSRSPIKSIFLLMLWSIIIAADVRAEGGNLKNNGGTINNTGTIRVKNQATGLPSSMGGTFEFFGTSQTIPATNYSFLKLTGTGTATTSGGDFSVNNDITLASSVTLNVESGKVISLNGNLVEQGYLTGSIQKVVDLSGATISSNFGNIGGIISWVGSAPGTTTVKRTSGTALTGMAGLGGGSPYQSIKRYYDIASTFSGSLSGSLTFEYRDSELSGQDASTLELWRSSDNGTTWRRQGGTVNTVARTITKSGLMGFSRWTASDATHPLGPMDIEGVAKTLTLTSGSGQSNTPGTTLSPFVVTVADGFGTPISGTTVNFTIASTPPGATGQTLTTLSALTAANGQASTTLKLGNTDGSYSVTTTSAGLVGSPVTFTATAATVVPPPPVSVPTAITSATPAIPNTTVFTTVGTPITARVVDQFENPMNGVTVNFTVSQKPTGTTGDSLSVLTAATSGTGVASTQLRLGTKAGTYIVRMTSPAIASREALITISAVADAPAKILALSAEDSLQTGSAGTQLPKPLTVTVADQYGNGVKGETVTFIITSKPAGATGDSLSLLTVLTDSLGRASTQFTFGSKTGEYTVNASVTGVPAPYVFRLNAVPSATRRLNLITGNSQRQPVTTTLQPFVISITDAQGNPVTGDTVTFALGDSLPDLLNAKLSTLKAITDAQGFASTTLTLGQKIGTYKVVARAANYLGSPSTFEATAIAKVPAQIVAVNAPGGGYSGKVGELLTNPFVVEARDEFGNPVAGVGVTYTITTRPAGAAQDELSLVTGTTNNEGRVQSILRLGSLTGLYAVEARIAGVTTPVRYTVTAQAGPLAGVQSLSQTTFSIAIGSTMDSSFVAKFVDRFGNAASSVAGISWAITKSPDGATGQTLLNTTSTTDLFGRVSGKLRAGSIQGEYEVTVTGLTPEGQPVSMKYRVFVLGSDARKMILASGDQQVGTVFTLLDQPLMVTILNDLNMPVQGETVTFRIFSKPDPNDSRDSLTVVTALTNEAGQAMTNLRLGGKVGFYRIEANHGNSIGSPVTFTLRAVAGPAKILAKLSGEGQVQPVVTTLINPFIASVTDAFGNPVENSFVQFAITAKPASTTDELITATSVRTDSLGFAQTTLKLGTKIGLYSVSATSAGLSGSPAIYSARATAAAAASLAKAAGDAQVQSVASTLNTPLTAIVTDRYDNPVVNTAVQFALISKPGLTTGESLSRLMVVTDSLGYAQTTLKLGTKVGLYVVTGTSTGLVGSPVTFTARATAGAPAVLAKVSGDLQSDVALKFLRDSLVVQVNDAFENPVPGAAISFAVESAPAGMKNDSLTTTTVLTDQTGRAWTFYRFGDQAGVYTISAISGTLNGSKVLFRLTATPISMSSRLVYTAGSGQSTPILTQLSSNLVVTMLNANGTPLTNATVTFVIDSVPQGATGYIPVQQTAKTDAQGRAIAQIIVGDKVGLYRITASSVNSMDTVKFRIQATHGLAKTITYAAGDKQVKPINNLLESVLSVMVKDIGGNAVRGTTVTFTFTDVPAGAVGQSFLNVQPVTDSLGIASVQLRLGSKVGVYHVSANAPALNGTPVLFTATAIAGAPAGILLASGDNQMEFTLTELARPFVAQLVDEGGNPVQGAAVQFAITGKPANASNEQLRIVRDISGVGGSVGAYLTLGDKVGLYTVTASSTALPGKSITFNAVATRLISEVFQTAMENNIADLTTVIDYLLGKIPPLTGADSIKVDVNKDGRINLLDVELMRQYMLNNSNSQATIAALIDGDSLTTVLQDSIDTNPNIRKGFNTEILSAFVESEQGLIFKISNSTSVKGFDLTLQLKSPVQMTRPDVVYEVAKMNSFSINVRDNTMHIVGYNLNNTPILPGENQSIFRLPVALRSIDQLVSGELMVSNENNQVLADRTMSGTIDKRKAIAGEIPLNFVLHQNYPNPFNAQTNIKYEVTQVPNGLAQVTIEVFNTMGQKVKTLVVASQAEGVYQVKWDGTDDYGRRLATGAYLYRMIAGSFQSAKKMIMLK